MNTFTTIINDELTLIDKVRAELTMLSSGSRTLGLKGLANTLGDLEVRLHAVIVNIRNSVNKKVSDDLKGAQSMSAGLLSAAVDGRVEKNGNKLRELLKWCRGVVLRYYDPQGMQIEDQLLWVSRMAELDKLIDDGSKTALAPAPKEESPRSSAKSIHDELYSIANGLAAPGPGEHGLDDRTRRWLMNRLRDIGDRVQKETNWVPPDMDEGRAQRRLALLEKQLENAEREWRANLNRALDAEQRYTDTQKNMVQLGKDLRDAERWEVGFRNIVTTLIGASREFDIEPIQKKVQEIIVAANVLYQSSAIAAMIGSHTEYKALVTALTMPNKKP